MSEMTREELQQMRALWSDFPSIVTIIDMAGERNRYRALLNDLHEYFDQRADADCEGDPPRFVPNEEMRWKVHIEDELKGR